MSARLMKMAVVGHTNTGKTSLIRTLARREDFGQVRDRGGTTRRITSTSLHVDGRPLVELFDSPGLENAPELIERLEARAGSRHDGPERINALLADRAMAGAFDHEARVLTLMQQVDVALYVIDAREPVWEKYQDELTLLSWCARPLVAVLNFTAAADSREAQWREALARVRLHSVLAFDAVVRDAATEQRLFAKLAGLLDPFADTLNAWAAHRREEEERRLAAARVAIAELLVDAAGARREFERDRPQQAEAALESLRRAVRERESACVQLLLDLYRFTRVEWEGGELPLSREGWREDLFDPATLADYGISTSGYVGAGLGAGALFDVSVGGLSLGTGTLVGGLAGAGTGVWRNVGSRLGERLTGRGSAGVDEATLRLLAWRQMALLEHLLRRGHASQQKVVLADADRWKVGRLPAALRRARRHPQWSTLNPGSGRSPARDRVVAALAGLFAPESAGAGDK